jgi:uncharacterized protein YdaU (DUF1376 family)
LSAEGLDFPAACWFTPAGPIMPLCPLNLDQFAADGWLLALSAEELGAWLRLARRAWEAGGTLADDAEVLAAVAGLPVDRWLGMRSRVLRALAAHQDGDRIRCTLIAEHLRTTADAEAAAQEQRRAAGRASAAARRRPPPDGQRPLNGRSTPVERPLSARADDAKIEVLDPHERSACAKREIETSALALTPERVAGILNAKIRAQADAKEEAWRRQKAYEMLVERLRPYASRMRRPVEVEASNIAADPRSDPGIVDCVLDRMVAADARAMLRSPVGYMIKTMGLGTDADAPPFEAYTWEQERLDKWAALRRAQADVSLQQASVQAAIQRVDKAARKAGGA